MNVIGIDPGKAGGVAIIDPGAEILSLFPMPMVQPGTKKGRPEYDLSRLVERLMKHGDGFVFIERLRPMPLKMGGSAANYQRGYATGALQGICVTLKRRYEFVTPSTWQKEFWKVRADTKQMSILTAERLFPEADLLPSERARKKHDGMADALLIAEYGRRHLNGLLT